MEAVRTNTGRPFADIMADQRQHLEGRIEDLEAKLERQDSMGLNECALLTELSELRRRLNLIKLMK